jgi:ABC-type uncharacterized transport system involved in gliding motility auxiliary subunit
MSLVTSFRAARWLRTINLVLQAVLFLTLFGGLNYLALQYNWGRFDLTRLRKHSLSAETRSYLNQLTQPVRVIITFAKKSDDANLAQAYHDVSDLLREYTYATETRPAGRITVEHKDPLQNPADARQYDLQENTVLFLSGERSRVVTFGELYTIKNKEREAFLGEQAFTAAILDVSSSEQKKIYFLVGHGETELNNDTRRGLSELRDNLRARNFALDTLDLARAREIPKDAALIVSVGATNRYDPVEQELLRRYLSENAGRVMLFIPPGLAITGLEDLLYDWGLVADNVWVFDNAPASQTDSGGLILNGYWPHPITQILIDNNQQLHFGAARSIRPNPSAMTDPSRTVARLIGAAPTAWGERDYTRGERSYTPGADLRGSEQTPLSLVSAAERLAAKDNLPFSIPVGRLIAFGSSDFITNERLSDRANAVLFFSSLKWLVARDTELNVPPRKIDKFQLSLSRQELLRLRYSLLFGLPAAAAILGLLVYWTRRR